MPILSFFYFAIWFGGAFWSVSGRFLDAETALNAYIVEINREGTAFLKKYLDELSQAALSDDEQLTIVNLAIQTIESDQRIEYTEIKFFKKIRARLPLSCAF